MGAVIYAFIEYDDAPEYFPPGSWPEPFAQESDRVINLTTNGGFTHAKDYLFLGALGGPCNPKGIEPLVRPRGLPPRVNWRIARKFDPDDPMVGWLTPAEVEAALDHMQIPREELSFGTQATLGILAWLRDRLGSDRVRFVFEMSD